MTTVTSSYVPVWRFADNNNNPLVGGKVYTYYAGTTTPAATYTDATGSTPLTNPIILNARGETANASGASCSVWFSTTIAYKIVVQDSSGNLIWTVDNYTIPSQAYSAAYADTFTATAGQTVFTLTGTVGSQSALDVSLDGATLVNGVDFTWTSPSTLTLTVGATAGQILLVKYLIAQAMGTMVAGGTSGQILYNNGGSVQGFTMSGDVTVVPTTGVATVNAPGTHITYTQGGTGSVTRTVTAKLQESISILDFGADPTGVADSKAAIQAAITYALNNPVSASGTFGGGMPAVYFPSGIYRVASTISVSSPNGLLLYGDGQQSTQIIFTATSSTLFTYTTYLNCAIRDMSIFAGSLATGGGLPAFTGDASQTNVCINFNSTSSGAWFTQTNVSFAYWGTVYQTTASTVNGDNHRHYSCNYYTNNYVWNNTNTQAVVWSFNNCIAYYNNNVFVNPGISLTVRGGDYINPGILLVGGLANTTLETLFDGVNMENYQNIDNTKSPQFISQTGGASLMRVTFRNVTARGGGTLAGKTSATLTNLFNIVCEDCYMTGNWNITLNSSQTGLLPQLVFRNCESVPTVVQTTVGGQGNRPMNLRYENHPLNGAEGIIQRNFVGTLGNTYQTVGIGSAEFSDLFRMSTTINNTSYAISCPIFMVSPYIAQLVEVDIDWTNNTVNTATITVYTDSTMTTTLATINTVAASGAYQNLQIPLASILARYQINSSSNPLYIVVNSAANCGLCSANFTLKFRQVN